MIRKQQIEIERQPPFLDRAGLTRSVLYNKIQQGLWPPKISLGARAIGFLKHETDEMLSAYANNYSQDEIRNLVTRLVEERKTLLEVSHG
jgi:prophage regulatory protein